MVAINNRFTRLIYHDDSKIYSLPCSVNFVIQIEAAAVCYICTYNDQRK